MRRLGDVDPFVVVLYFPVEVRRRASHALDCVFLRERVVQFIYQLFVRGTGQKVIHADGYYKPVFSDFAGEQGWVRAHLCVPVFLEVHVEFRGVYVCGCWRPVQISLQLAVCGFVLVVG